MKSRNILIVSGHAFSKLHYAAFSEFLSEGHALYHLGDGYFEPDPGYFRKNFYCELTDTLKVLEVLRSSGVAFDAVTQTCYEILPPLVAAIAEKFDCIGNHPESAFRARNKLLMRNALHDAGVPIPRYLACTSYEELKEAVRVLGGPCVAKPIAANSSFGVFLATPETEDIELQNRYQLGVKFLADEASQFYEVCNYSPEELNLFQVEWSGNMITDYLVEDFVPGPEVSVDSLVQDGVAQPVSIADQIRRGHPYFSQIAERTPWVGQDEKLADILRVNEEAIKAIGISNSPAHVELILTPDGPVVVEVAARMGGDNILDSVVQTKGINLMSEAIRISLGNPCQIPPPPTCHMFTRYLLPERKGRISKIETPAFWPEGITEVSLFCEVGDQISPPPESYDFLGYISARGNSPDEAQAAVEEMLQHLTLLVDTGAPHEASNCSDQNYKGD